MKILQYYGQIFNIILLPIIMIYLLTILIFEILTNKSVVNNTCYTAHYFTVIKYSHVHKIVLVLLSMLHCHVIFCVGSWSCSLCVVRLGVVKK